MFPGLDLYCTNPALQIMTAGKDLDDLSDLQYLVDRWTDTS